MKSIIQEKKLKKQTIERLRGLQRDISTLSANEILVLNAISCVCMHSNSNTIYFCQLAKFIHNNFGEILTYRQIRYAKDQLLKKIWWLSVRLLTENKRNRLKYSINEEVLNILQLMKQNGIYIKPKEGIFEEKICHMTCMIEKSPRSLEIASSGVWVNLIPFVNAMIRNISSLIKTKTPVGKIVEKLNRYVEDDFTAKMRQRVFKLVAKFSGLFKYIESMRRCQKKIVGYIHCGYTSLSDMGSLSSRFPSKIPPPQKECI